MSSHFGGSTIGTIEGAFINCCGVIDAVVRESWNKPFHLNIYVITDNNCLNKIDKEEIDLACQTAIPATISFKIQYAVITNIDK